MCNIKANVVLLYPFKDLFMLPNSEPTMGMTPFMEAAAEGHEIILQLFLRHVSLRFLVLTIFNEGAYSAFKSIFHKALNLF